MPRRRGSMWSGRAVRPYSGTCVLQWLVTVAPGLLGGRWPGLRRERDGRQARSLVLETPTTGPLLCALRQRAILDAEVAKKVGAGDAVRISEAQHSHGVFTALGQVISGRAAEVERPVRRLQGEGHREVQKLPGGHGARSLHTGM